MHISIIESLKNYDMVIIIVKHNIVTNRFHHQLRISSFVVLTNIKRQCMKHCNFLVRCH